MKQKLVFLSMAAIMVWGMAGCGAKEPVESIPAETVGETQSAEAIPETVSAEQEEENDTADSRAEVAEENIADEAEASVETAEAAGTEAAAEEEFDTAELFTGWLPDSVSQVKAETAPHPLLQQTIADYYEIPKEEWEATKYYYNYVDLNGDGTEEIFAVAIGSYVSGSGGSSALWCMEQEGSMQVLQAFTLVNTPIIVTKDAVNGQEFGARGLLLQRSGGGAETEIVQLTCEDGVYTNVADAQAVESIEGMEGTAIICNDLIADMENGNYLTLANE